jgi:transcriptional regulator with XRE-family HTH domain
MTEQSSGEGPRITLNDAPRLGEFLRAKRTAADPARWGFESDRHRRVPGLRREELAQLSQVSVASIARIEQGRTHRASKDVLTALADALELSGQERAFLFVAAGRSTDDDGRRSPATLQDHAVPVALAQLVHDLSDVPALVLNRRLDILLWSRAAAALFVDFGLLTRRDRNLVRLAFCHERYRALFGHQWETMARNIVAALRSQADRCPDDTALQALVGELVIHDSLFAAWWGATTHPASKPPRLTCHHPTAGEITLETHVLRSEGRQRADLTLVTCAPRPNSPSQQALRLLLEGIGDVDRAVAG